MRRLHANTDLEAIAKGGVDVVCKSLPSGPTSAGRAAAVLENNCIRQQHSSHETLFA